MAVLGTITRRHTKLLVVAAVAMLGCSLYILFKEENPMLVDLESIASQEVASYAQRQSLAPDAFRLTGRTEGPGGRQLFDYETDAPSKHHLRVDVAKDGSVEVSRMIE